MGEYSYVLDENSEEFRKRAKENDDFFEGCFREVERKLKEANSKRKKIKIKTVILSEKDETDVRRK